ncbi:transposase [Halorubrum sp. LN27]|uniref:transposase n=1 Tax=Halorubrum sp. LN27 TaxID=2801032 RepID=UPI00190AFD21|nr:transposase [Halorubrum sp. LN27]
MTDDPENTVKERVVAQATSLFEVHDHVVRVIGNLDLPMGEVYDEYGIKNDDTFDFEAITRLYLYKEAAEMKQEEVTSRVKNWEYLQQLFGLDRAPTQAAFSYTKKHRFSYEFRSLLNDIAKGIRDAGRQQDHYNKDLKSPDPTPSPDEIEDTSTPLHHYVDDHAPDIISAALNDVCPAFDTGRAHNVVHEDRTVWEHQILMSLSDRAGTRSAFRTFNKFRTRALHNDTHVRAVKKLGTPHRYTLDDFSGSHRPTPYWRKVADTIQPQFSDAVENMLGRIREADEFSEPVVAAIDTVRVPVSVTPYKGEADVEPGDTKVKTKNGNLRVPKDDYPKMIKGGNDKPVGYEYATLTIVGNNDPIVLAVEPVRHNSNWELDNGMSVTWAETVNRLMQQATELVDIHLVMADRAFENREVKHVLDQYHDVNYLLPKTKRSEAMKEDLEEVESDPSLVSRVQPASFYLDENKTRYVEAESDDTVGEDGYSHDLNFMYVPAKKDDWVYTELDDVEYTVFVTNREDVLPEDAMGFCNRYSSRWDIEIEYKMIKPLLPSIASKDYRMQYFSFVFSCLLYNLWRLTGSR